MTWVKYQLAFGEAVTYAESMVANLAMSMAFSGMPNFGFHRMRQDNIDLHATT